MEILILQVDDQTPKNQVFGEFEQHQEHSNIQEVKIVLSDDSDNESLVELVIVGNGFDDSANNCLEPIEENLPSSSSQAEDEVCATVSSTPQHVQGVTLEHSEYRVVEVEVPVQKVLKEEDYLELCTTLAAKIDKINSSVQPITCRSYIELTQLEDKKKKYIQTIVKLREDQLEALGRKISSRLKKAHKAKEKKLMREAREEKQTLEKEVKKLRSEAISYSRKLTRSEQLRANMRKKVRNITAQLHRRNLILHRLNKASPPSSPEKQHAEILESDFSDSSY
jgi:hypothetical protein